MMTGPTGRLLGPYSPATSPMSGTARLHATTVAESLMRHGFSIRSQIIWAKERLVMSRGDYHWQHEPCWYAVRNKGHWTGDRKQTTLWTISERRPGHRNGAQHPEAGRMHAPADAEQQQPRASGL